MAEIHLGVCWESGSDPTGPVDRGKRKGAVPQLPVRTEVRWRLGYADMVPDLLPRALVDVIPNGPGLDPVAARAVANLPAGERAAGLGLRFEKESVRACRAC